LVTNSKLDVELIFMNTDPQTVEKSLGIKSTTKKKQLITDTNDGDDEGTSKQAHTLTESNKKKKQPSIPGALPFTFLVFLLILNIDFGQF